MKRPRRYVRQMPKIYGNLQRPRPSFSAIFRWLSAAAWLVAALAAVYALFFSGWFTVHTIQVEGTHFISADDIRSYIPPRTNIWFLPKAQIEANVLSQSSVNSVVILRGLPDTVKIIVQERQPVAIWLAGDTASLIDNQGIAFRQYGRATIPLPGTEIGDLLKDVPRIYDTKAVPVKDGQQIVSASFITYIQSLQTQMATLVPTYSIDHYEIADTTYDLTVVTKPGMRIQVSTLADAGVQVRNLSRLITQKNISPTAQVDLRIDRWAYVK